MDDSDRKDGAGKPLPEAFVQVAAGAAGGGEATLHWLPRDYSVHLTAFELGALWGMLTRLQIRRTPEQLDQELGEICAPGPDGQPVASTFLDVLLDRVNEAVRSIGAGG